VGVLAGQANYTVQRSETASRAESVRETTSHVGVLTGQTEWIVHRSGGAPRAEFGRQTEAHVGALAGQMERFTQLPSNRAKNNNSTGRTDRCLMYVLACRIRGRTGGHHASAN